MKTLKENGQTLLLIVFEAVVGVMLLVNPEGFTKTVIIIFGALFLILGVISLVRFLRDKKENINNPLAITAAVVSLIFGVIFAFFSDAVINLIAAIAVIYGVAFAISGIFKLQNYFQSKKIGLPVSKISILSGVLAVAVGVLIMLYPKDAAISVWMLTGILLLAEAVVDVFSVIRSAKNSDR